MCPRDSCYRLFVHVCLQRVVCLEAAVSGAPSVQTEKRTVRVDFKGIDREKTRIGWLGGPLTAGSREKIHLHHVPWSTRSTGRSASLPVTVNFRGRVW